MMPKRKRAWPKSWRARPQTCSGAIDLEHDPEKWIPVSRLREALPVACSLGQRFGRRSQVGQDHAPTISFSPQRQYQASAHVPAESLTPTGARESAATVETHRTV